VGDEPDIIEAAVPAGAGILELGSGVGRVTHPLLRRGFTVTAVDESPQMLERVHGARTVCSPIEALELHESFDVVLLGSYLVHAGDPRVRQGLLRTCRRHVADDGCVLIQREVEGRHDHLPRYVDMFTVDGYGHLVMEFIPGQSLEDVLEARGAALPGGARLAGGLARGVSSDPVGPGVRSVYVEYVFPDAQWTQTFLSRPLTTGAFELALAEAGLAVDAYLTDDRTWVRAVPAPGRGASNP